jgi:MtfA peptidase
LPTASPGARGRGSAGAGREPSTLIDAYGATDPAEFFAVVTEVFFEQPQALAAEAPQVYRELADLFGVEPLAW